MELYKDLDKIKRRSAISSNLRELAEIISRSDYGEILLPYPRKRYSHNEQHIGCTMPLSASQESISEKRICRCWNYFNKPECNRICTSCTFEFKKENVSNYEIVDYEVPTVFAMKQLGGIDWLLKREEKIIAAEVKPPNSQENIVRMITEILTYTIDTPYTPAICFFIKNIEGEPSKPYVDYMRYKDDKNFQFIKQRTELKVLYITYDEKTFCIHDEEEEPLI